VVGHGQEAVRELAVDLHAMDGEEVAFRHDPGGREGGLGGHTLLRLSEPDGEILVTVHALGRHELPAQARAVGQPALIPLDLGMTTG